MDCLETGRPLDPAPAAKLEASLINQTLSRPACSSRAITSRALSGEGVTCPPGTREGKGGQEASLGPGLARPLVLAGSWLTGLPPPPPSCRFGRKPILSGSYLLLAASGSGAAFSPSFAVYMVLRFLCGFGMAGVTLSTVILSEPRGRRWGARLALSRGVRGRLDHGPLWPWQSPSGPRSGHDSGRQCGALSRGLALPWEPISRRRHSYIGVLWPPLCR